MRDLETSLCVGHYLGKYVCMYTQPESASPLGRGGMRPPGLPWFGGLRQNNYHVSDGSRWGAVCDGTQLALEGTLRNRGGGTGWRLRLSGRPGRADTRTLTLVSDTPTLRHTDRGDLSSLSDQNERICSLVTQRGGTGPEGPGPPFGTYPAPDFQVSSVKLFHLHLFFYKFSSNVCLGGFAGSEPSLNIACCAGPDPTTRSRNSSAMAEFYPNV